MILLEIIWLIHNRSNVFPNMNKNIFSGVLCALVTLFHCFLVHTQDLAHISHQQRETLWKHINEIKTLLHPEGQPQLFRTSSSASTASVHSSGGSNSQVYRATRFTLKQTLSFKVEKEDYDECSH